LKTPIPDPATRAKAEVDRAYAKRREGPRDSGTNLRIKNRTARRSSQERRWSQDESSAGDTSAYNTSKQVFEDLISGTRKSDKSERPPKEQRLRGRRGRKYILPYIFVVEIFPKLF
jgi:hypothetical protein